MSLPVQTARQYMAAFLRLFYPRICLACETDLYAGEEFICLHCSNSMVPTDHAAFLDNPVYGLLRPHVRVHRAAAAYPYGRSLVVQTLLHEVKYGGNRDLAVHLGRRLGNALVSHADWTDNEILIPLPLHRRKLAKRGFNQSEAICRGIAEEIGASVCADVLYRFRRTTTQTMRRRIERWDNVRGSFGIQNGDKLSGKNVLLVDDVITTGATISAAVDVLAGIEGIRVSVTAVAFSGEL